MKSPYCMKHQTHNLDGNCSYCARGVIPSMYAVKSEENKMYKYTNYGDSPIFVAESGSKGPGMFSINHCIKPGESIDHVSDNVFRGSGLVCTTVNPAFNGIVKQAPVGPSVTSQVMDEVEEDTWKDPEVEYWKDKAHTLEQRLVVEEKAVRITEDSHLNLSRHMSKIEADLGKVRTAIGTERFNSILGIETEQRTESITLTEVTKSKWVSR